MGRLPSDLVVLTFNVLCPVYKRLGPDHGGMRRESESPALWKPRMVAVIAEILSCRPLPDVICLQEFWFAPECVQLFRDAFASSYTFFLKKRPGKEDGLATLVRKRSRAFSRSGSDVIIPSFIRDFSLLPGSDRVALLVALPLAPPSLCPTVPVSQKSPPPADYMPRQLVIVNTHLTFPHGNFLHRLRLEQARSISRAVASYAASLPSAGCDALVLGDLNGGPRSRVCSHFRNVGYDSCLADVWGHKVEPATHKNHLGESVFVDHIFLQSFIPAATPQKKPRRLPLRFLTSRHSCAKEPQPAALRERPVRRFAPFRKAQRTLTAASAMAMANMILHNDEDDDASSLSRSDSVRSANLSHLESDVMDALGPKLSRDKPMSMSMSAIEDGASALGCSVAPVQARVLPDGVPTDTWPIQGRCSDHRPVCVEFRYSWSVLVREDTDNSLQSPQAIAATAVVSGLCAKSRCT